MLDYSGHVALRPPPDGRSRRDGRLARHHAATRATAAASNGWAPPGDIAVAPSTPVQDYRLHVRAWQHHFAALFGLDALSASAAFLPPRWRCRTIRMSPMSSSGH